MNLNSNNKYKIFLIPALCYYLSSYRSRKKYTEKSYCFSDLDKRSQQYISKKETDIYIWGKGIADNTSIYTNFHPHRIKNFENNTNINEIPKNIIDITFGDHFAACIDKNNNLYVWKEPKLNSEKSEGINNHERKGILKLAKGLKVDTCSFTQDKLFILDKKGNVYFYNIVINNPKNEEFFTYSSPEPEVYIKDNLIHVKELKNIKMISTGKDHFIALDMSGKLFGMGDDSYGQLGLGTFSEQREQQMKHYTNFVQRRERIPKLIETPEIIEKICCGENHTLALSASGNVYAFGNNRFLQLSNDPLYRKSIIGLNKPTLIPSEKFNKMKVIDIAASRNCSFFICLNEQNKTYHFYSSGEGLRGQLGQNVIKHMSDVEIMSDISGLINSETMKPFEPLKLKCGNNHCMLLFKNPRVLYVWGNNEFGELGTKDRAFYESPIPMLEEYTLPFNILNFGVGNINSAFICEKVDPVKKKQILAEDQRIFEEELQKTKKKVRRVKKKKDENEHQSYLKTTFNNFFNSIKKYL